MNGCRLASIVAAAALTVALALVLLGGSGGSRRDGSAEGGVAAISAAVYPSTPASVVSVGVTGTLPPPVDVTVSPTAPFSINNVERLAARGGDRDAVGAFELAYTVRPRFGGPDQPDVRARVACRVRELALVVEPPPEELRRTAGETRWTTYFRPDPYAVVPGDCEISFRYRGESVAGACLRGHVLSDGGCSDERLVRAPAGAAMTESDFQVRDGTLAGTAVITVDAERSGHAAWARCEDGARVISARDASPLPELDGMPAGTSRYVRLTADLAERIPVARGRCEVGIVAGREPVALFCVASRRADLGPCAPPLGGR